MPPLKLFAALSGLAALLQVLPCVATAQEISAYLDPYGKDSTHFERLFLPLTTNMAAISPDGTHVAYTRREGTAVYVCVIELSKPSVLKAHVLVADDQASAEMIDERVTESSRAMVCWLGWSTNNRVVVETNQRDGALFESTSSRFGGAIFAFNADGSDGRLLVNERHFSHTVTKPNLPKASEAGEARATNTDLSNPLVGTGADTEDPTAPNFNRTYTAPHIFDFAPDKEEEVIVRTDIFVNSVRSLNYIVARLNTLSGKVSHEEECYVPNLEIALPDRQGKARISVPYSSQYNFPVHFNLQPAGFFERAKKLDDVVKAPLAGSLRLSPETFLRERSIPLGFDEDPELLYVASNVGRDRFGIFSYNLKTGQFGKLSIEHPSYDLFETAPNRFPDQPRIDFHELDADTMHARVANLNTDDALLVYDRYSRKMVGVRFSGQRMTTAWLNPELAKAQATLEGLYAGANIRIVGWDKAMKRFLLRTESSTNPGSFAVYDLSANRLYDLVPTAPWLPASESNVAAAFSFKGANGGLLSGLITLPRRVRIQPIPTVVYCQSVPWKRVGTEFTPEIQALSEMGYAVLQVNTRGTAGYGRQQLQLGEENRSKAQVEDLLQVIDAVSPRFNLNTKAVGLVGESLGSYLALRALQFAPRRFKCAVVINPVVDLKSWADNANWSREDALPLLQKAYFEKELQEAGSPLLDHAKLLTQPILFMGYPGPTGETNNRLDYQAMRTLAFRAADTEKANQVLDINADYLRGRPRSRAQVYRNIEGFLNINMYRYKSVSGQSDVISEAAPSAPQVEKPKVQITP